MYRRFIGTVAAASIAITALGAVPASADERETKRLLKALLGIAVVGAIIHEANKDDHVVARHKQRPAYQPAPKRHYKPKVQPRPLPDRVNRRLLPGKCLRGFQTRRGVQRGFGKNCLQANYRFSNRLPRHCRIQTRSRHGSRTFYQARCLQNQGYRLARR